MLEDEVKALSSEEELEALFSSSYTIDQYKQHVILLKKSKLYSKYFIFLDFLGQAQNSILLAIWILFAMSFSDYTNNFLVVIIIGQLIVRSLSVLIMSYFCDKYGFDKCVILTSAFVVIGMILACTSHTIFQFGVALAIEALSGNEHEIICAAFIFKMLPLQTSSFYYGYEQSAIAFGFLFGMLTASVLASFVANGYRAALYLSLSFAFIRLLFILWKIRNCQQPIIDEQMKFVHDYKQENEKMYKRSQSAIDDLNAKRFPLCLESIQKQDKETSVKYFYFFDSPSLGNKSKWYVFDLGIHLFLWMINATYFIAFFPWYLVFMVSRFQVPIIIPALQLVCSSLVYGITSSVITAFAEKWSLLKLYCFIIVCCLVRIFVLLYGFVYTGNDKYGDNVYWAWALLIGFVLSALSICIQIIITEQQPKMDTSKICAIKIAGRYIFAGIVSALVSYFWDYGPFEKHICLGIIMACVDAIAIIIICSLIVCKIYRYGIRFSVGSLK